MKLSNYDNITKVIKALKRVNDAIAEAKAMVDRNLDKPDSGGVEGILKIGYECHLHKYSDSSGDGVDMGGCYVAVEMAQAAVKILQVKSGELESWLVDVGVDPFN